MTFPHEQVCRVGALRGDVAALGGAVTVALCGHWEHEGPCRWPHRTSTTPEGGDGRSWQVTVRFDAPASDQDAVRHRIRDALAAGVLVGPDGTTTTWRLAP